MTRPTLRYATHSLLAIGALSLWFSCRHNVEPIHTLEGVWGDGVELVAGEVVTFTLELSAEQPWRIAVEQLGIDVVVEVAAEAEEKVGGDGDRHLLTVDRPLDRDGTEYVVLEPPRDQRYQLSIRSQLASAPAGRVRITVDALDRSTASGRRTWLAEEAETEAAMAYARGDAEGRRKALAAYLRALSHWRASHEDRREALALYSIGVLHRLLGEPPAALNSARRAEALFAALDEPRWQASARNEIGLSLISLGELAEARELFESSLALLEKAPDPFRRAIAQSNVCLTALHRGELRQGVECYRRAEALYLAAGDPQSEAIALTNSGRAYDILGEPDQALRSYEEALAIQRASGDASGEALTLNNLAVLHAAQGDLNRALTLYGRVADAYRKLDEKDRLALALSNTGSTYWSLGETARARSFFAQALTLQRQAEDRRGQALTLTNLARLDDQEGEAGRARAQYEEALELRRRSGNRRGEGRSLFDLGRHHLATGELGAALQPLGQALAIARQVEDRAGEARALAKIGEAQTEAGKLDKAARVLTEALHLFRSIGATTGEARALISLARLARQRGRLPEARSQVAEGLKIIESLRAKISSPDLKASFLASRREAYELEIVLLMELHRGDPKGGYSALALASSERARARSLLELLGESGASTRAGIDPALLRNRLRLLHRLDTAERQRRALAARSGSSQEIATRESAVETILAALDRVDDEIRGANPAFSSLIQPPVLDAPAIQQLLDHLDGPETVFLIYSLGVEKSFLWWVEAGALQVFELPPEAVIEVAAWRVYAGLSTLDPTSSRADARASAELATMILGPVAPLLDGQRLAVVADGVLHHIPLAALPLAASGGGVLAKPLVNRHEIVRLPSASSLALQRQGWVDRPPAPRRALVIADPVFGPDDARLRLDRLPASRREAQAIASLAPRGEVRLVTGHAASREAVSGDALAPYRVVHFATHGLINDRTPRLSGLALSRLDEEGRPVDGFLRLHEVYNLSLNADLVVLSGCNTASGRGIRGEGLVGLTQGFMYAGARRVMASLWRVQDRATAELMERFYRSLWIDGLEPAAALRAAQLSLARQRRWQDPYYWAGFILQGDWRPVEPAGLGFAENWQTK